MPKVRGDVRGHKANSRLLSLTRSTRGKTARSQRSATRVGSPKRVESAHQGRRRLPEPHRRSRPVEGARRTGETKEQRRESSDSQRQRSRADDGHVARRVGPERVVGQSPRRGEREAAAKRPGRPPEERRRVVPAAYAAGRAAQTPGGFPPGRRRRVRAVVSEQPTLQPRDGPVAVRRAVQEQAPAVGRVETTRRQVRRAGGVW